jgi:hypothetical protein
LSADYSAHIAGRDDALVLSLEVRHYKIAAIEGAADKIPYPEITREMIYEAAQVLWRDDYFDVTEPWAEHLAEKMLERAFAVCDAESGKVPAPAELHPDRAE